MVLAKSNENHRFIIHGSNTRRKVFGVFSVRLRHILLAIAFGVITLLDIRSTYQILLTLLAAAMLYWLCFFNDYFRNKIVGVMSKAELHKEKRNS